MIRAAGGVLLAAGALILAACGACSSSSANTAGGGDGGGADVVVEAGPTIAQACADFATAFCGRLEACTPFALQTSYGDPTTCGTRGALLCTAALGASGTLATPSQMEDCAKAVEAQTCDEALDNSQPSACMVPGSNGDGAVCGSNAQCKSGYCKLNTGSLCGTCAERAAAGAQCVIDADCQATLVCNSGSCVGPAQAGAACGPSQPCLRSLACIGDGTDAGARHCATPLAEGAACTGQGDCDVARGVYCNTQTKKCAQTQIATAGSPCGIVNGALVVCGAGASCAGVKNNQGTCHPPAADGAPCGPDIYCVAPAICTSTARCTLPNPSVCH